MKSSTTNAGAVQRKCRGQFNGSRATQEIIRAGTLARGGAKPTKENRTGRKTKPEPKPYIILYTYIIHVQHTVLIHEMEQGSQVTRGRCIVGKLVQRHRVRVVLQCLREWKRLPCGSASCLFAARCAVRWAEGDVDSEAFVLGNAPACDGKARTRSTAGLR